ncbi:hypothetical protein [Streptomyces sp. H27-D2]|uniref:hypothetical protein n=1 Tax=Streptomyces sp. H27-D2 TaxID=3046304 RepID=UPI002DB7986A|nr:hypothetical protein [Streptomyces sp. H27-D2]MEC4015143.1 hypothetical protein [Streptomyces sp. H27-D2]
MTDPAEPRRVSTRTALLAFVAVTVLAFGGVYLIRSVERADAVEAAPRTAAAQSAKAGGAASAGLPGVRDCGAGAPLVKPRVITLTCADAGVVASALRWDSYAERGAEGAGVVQVSGAQAGSGGGSGSYPARFRLYGPKNVDGAMAFTGLEVRYTGSTPFGDASETYSVA